MIVIPFTVGRREIAQPLFCLTRQFKIVAASIITARNQQPGFVENADRLRAANNVACPSRDNATDELGFLDDRSRRVSRGSAEPPALADREYRRG